MPAIVPASQNPPCNAPNNNDETTNDHHENKPSGRCSKSASHQPARQVAAKRQLFDQRHGDGVADDPQRKPRGGPGKRNRLQRRGQRLAGRTGRDERDPDRKGHTPDGDRAPRNGPAQVCVAAPEQPQHPRGGDHAHGIQPVDAGGEGAGDHRAGHHDEKRHQVGRRRVVVVRRRCGHGRFVPEVAASIQQRRRSRARSR